MAKNRTIRIFIPGALLVFFVCISLYIRIALPYDRIFSGGLVKFAETDAWYYLRLVDSLVHNFPKLITFDPYTFFPHGMDVFWHPLFTYLLGGISIILGAGKPDEQTINMVAAYLPPVLGALTVIPVFFVGKAVLNRWVGIIAAALIAIMPGEFLHRSMLGFTDHHIAETLSITIAILFFILAIKSGKTRLNMEAFRRKDYSQVTSALLYSVLAGISLGVYLLFWVGGLFFLFFFLLYFIIQFIVDHLKKIPTEYLGIIGTVCFFCAAAISIIFLPGSHYRVLYILALPVMMLVPMALSFISWLLTVKNISKYLFPIIIIVIAALATLFFIIFMPSTFFYAIEQFSIFFGIGAKLSITEVQPLLIQDGKFSFDFALSNFSLNFFLSLISIGLLICSFVRKNNKPEILFLVLWSLFIFIATLGQRRFAYYFAINVALLSGYLAWSMFSKFIGQRHAAKVAPIDKPRVNKNRIKEKHRRKTLSPNNNITKTVFGALLIVLLIFYPVIGPLPKPWPAGPMPALITLNNTTIITDAWYNTLLWLKNNTPDPFNQPDYYYRLYEPPTAGESYNYPDSAYGVMAWWDYGHMITRISHRIPICNPHQYGAVAAAKFFTSQDDSEATAILQELNGRYIIIDTDTATTKFHGGIIPFASSNVTEYFEMYYQQQDGKLRGDYYFYPEYYKSFAIRLYNFDGKAVAPQDTTVIFFQNKRFHNGESYKEIMDMKRFRSYEQAIDYVTNQKTSNVRIVGISPYISPIPLGSLTKYSLIHSSSESIVQPDVGKMAEVKVFEFKQ